MFAIPFALLLAAAGSAQATIKVQSTVAPAALPEPGGTFSYGVKIINNGAGPVTITSLVDSIYGNLSTQGTCTNAIGSVIAGFGSYSCSYSGPFTGNANSSQTNVVSAVAGGFNDDDFSVATISDLQPSLTVTNTPSPAFLPAPGGSFTWTVAIKNTSPIDPEQITMLTDNVYGNLDVAAPGNTCTTALGTVLAPGATYTCTHVRSFNGSDGATQTNTTTATVQDDEANSASFAAPATIRIGIPPVAPGPTGSVPTTTVAPALTAAVPAKKCKKGQRLRRGRCVRRKKKKK